MKNLHNFDELFTHDLMDYGCWLRGFAKYMHFTKNTKIIKKYVFKKKCLISMAFSLILLTNNSENLRYFKKKSLKFSWFSSRKCSKFACPKSRSKELVSHMIVSVSFFSFLIEICDFQLPTVDSYYEMKETLHGMTRHRIPYRGSIL